MPSHHVRTSITDPLRLATLPCGAGALGLTFCPGKKGPSFYGAPWDRDLTTDVRAIRDWGATAVVTVMEEHEFSMFGVPGLGDAIERAGMDWHWLPVADGQTPEPAFEALWVYAGHVLRRRLRAGERIAIHCRGGLGRTGTIAARLRVDFGDAPEQAITAVRAARPGAIENAPQEAYVRALRPPAVPADRADRVLGCLLGGAVGDAFGYAIEFDSLAAIQRKHGESGLRAPILTGERLIVSDDTQMTLFTAEGLLAGLSAAGSQRSGVLLEAIRDATLAWAETQRGDGAGSNGPSGLRAHPALWARRAPGNTCLSACHAGATGTPEAPINTSKGCGGVMRVAPIGLLPDLGAEQAFDMAARAAAQTHGHPSGYLSAGMMAATIRRLLDGVPLAEAAVEAMALAEPWPGSAETTFAVRMALQRAASPAVVPCDDVVALGEGWVGEEALAIGLYAALMGTDMVDTLRLAANHGGDSDSTASIAGQLRGAWLGLDGLPNGWIRPLDVLVPLLDVARSMMAPTEPA